MSRLQARAGAVEAEAAALATTESALRAEARDATARHAAGLAASEQAAEASAAKLSELEVRQSGWERTRGQQSSKRALYTVKNARNTPKSVKNALNTLL